MSITPASRDIALPQLRMPEPWAGQAQTAQLTPVNAGQAARSADPSRVPTTDIEVRPGDTLESLAGRYGTTIDQLALINPDVRNLNDIRAGDTLAVPTNRQVVQLREGDTLEALADRYGVSVEQLQAANGIADPDAIQAGQRIAVVPGVTYGLDRDSQVQAYIDDVLPLQQDWASLTPTERLDRLDNALNERLRAAGIPEVEVVSGGVGTANGVYDFRLNEIGIDPALLNQNTVTSDQLRDVADTLYHEGRHATQWFDMARLEVARGNDPASLGIEAEFAEAARNAPALDPDTQRGRFADAMYESVYGAGAADRNAILGNITADNYELYRALPEEADAWRVGGKVQNFWPRS